MKRSETGIQSLLCALSPFTWPIDLSILISLNLFSYSFLSIFRLHLNTILIFSLFLLFFLFFPFTFLLFSSLLFHFFVHFTYSNRHVCKTGGKTSIFIFQLCLSRSSCSLSSCLYRFCFLVRHLQGQKGWWNCFESKSFRTAAVTNLNLMKLYEISNFAFKFWKR